MNWDDGDGMSPQLRRMLKSDIHPSIKVVLGNKATGKSFGDVPGVPTVFLFDGRGREVLRAGQYLSGADVSHLDRATLEKTLASLK